MQLSPNVLQEVNQTEDHARIGKYASENGNAAAAVKKVEVTHEIGDSTVRLFKKGYLEEIKKRENPEDEVTTLPTLTRGRKVMLGEQLDEKVKSYVLVLQNAERLLAPVL